MSLYVLYLHSNMTYFPIEVQLNIWSILFSSHIFMKSVWSDWRECFIWLDASCWEPYLHFCHEGACNVDAHGIPIFTGNTYVDFQLRLKGSDKHSPQNILITFGREKVLTFDISGASRSVSGLQQFHLWSVQQTSSPFLGHLRLLCVCEPDHTSRTK